MVSRLSSKAHPPLLPRDRSRRFPHHRANPECFERILRYPSAKDGQTIRAHNRRLRLRRRRRRLRVLPDKEQLQKLQSTVSVSPSRSRGTTRAPAYNQTRACVSIPFPAYVRVGKSEGTRLKPCLPAQSKK